MLRKNKRGWIRIVEAVIAVLLVAGVMLTLVNKGYIGKKDISSQVYGVETSVLREIELDDILRNEVLNAALTADNGVESDESGFPEGVKSSIVSGIPDYLECQAKICPLKDVCKLKDADLSKDIFVRSVAITVTTQTTQYSPRQLKLFCWTK
jgi:hypothetical protein